MNKYQTWYQNITDRARDRKLDCYTEKHHIIPRSLGGTDDADNLVDLTAREHFVCHWLLVKMNSGEDRAKMVYALRMMRAEKSGQQRYKTKITARVYETIKQEYALMQSTKVSGKNNPMFGDKFYRSEDGKQRQKLAISGNSNGSKQPLARKKIQDSKLGKTREPFSDEWRSKMSAAKQGENNKRFGVEVSVETRKKIGDKIRGRKQTDEEKKRRADAIRGSKREKKLCPHCNQLIAVNGYARFHGDNCRHRSQP
jgi:hypothetical protein